MTLIKLFVAATVVLLAPVAVAAPNEGLSLGLRAGQVAIKGDVKDTQTTAWGFSMNGIGPKGFDFLWGTHFQIGVDLMFGGFDYEGTAWPFTSDKNLEFSLFTIAPGVTFFGTLPIQLQLGLPISQMDLNQADGFHQSYGTTGYLVRIGRLIAPDFTVSVEYETHMINQTIADKSTEMQFDFMTATIGWVPGDD